MAPITIQATPPTPEEQAAMQKYLSLIDADEDLRVWKKYADEAADRNLLLIGLRQLNLDYESAYKSMKECYRLIIKVYPETASLVDLDNIRKLIEKRMFHVLNRKDKTSPFLTLFRVGDWKPSQFKVEEITFASFLYGYAALQKWPELQNRGVPTVGVTDISGFKLKHARTASIKLARKSVRFYNTTPSAARKRAVEEFKGAWVAVNSKGLFVKTYKMVKKVIPKEIRKFVHITKKDYSVIHQYVPKDQLPVEFGGTVNDAGAWVTDLESILLEDTQLWKLLKEARAQLLQKTKGIKPSEEDDEPTPEEGDDDDNDELAGFEDDGEEEAEDDDDDEKDNTKL